ncbi:MAG: HAD-IIA family hydrolase, partial [Ilumatobacteraceae bacterium]
ADDATPCVVLCDLDGVVWLANHPIPGSVEAIAAMRSQGHRVLFVTNNSSVLLEDQQQALAAIGIPAEGDVLTSAQAAALLVQPGERVHVCGGPGVVQALRARGAEIVGHGPVDVVVVGFHRDFDYDGLSSAASAVRRGARLIGTNDDATYPTPNGPIPGCGAILAAVAVAGGATPVVAGKPYPPMVALVASTVGAEAARHAVMVGDRPDTDGRFAAAIGCRFALVWTGVTAAGAKVTPAPDYAVADLAAVAKLLPALSPGATAQASDVG